jgi:hypothetical protein
VKPRKAKKAKQAADPAEEPAAGELAGDPPASEAKPRKTAKAKSKASTSEPSKTSEPAEEESDPAARKAGKRTAEA